MKVSPGWPRFLLIFLFCALGAIASAGELTVVSYNVYNYLPMKRSVEGKYGDAPKPESEIAALVEIIVKLQPDILGVSEMGDTSQLTDFQTRLKNAGVDLPHSEWLQAADKERHLALLSRYPIIDRNSVSNLPIAINGRSEAMQRGILDVTVQVDPHFSLRLLGAHFKSRRIVPEFDQAALRALEARELRKHVDEILKGNPETKLLIYGDLNDTKNQPAIKELFGKKPGTGAMRLIEISDESGEKWTYYWKVADEYSRIDYLLASPALWPHLLLEKSYIPRFPNLLAASDHRPLVLKIQIPD